MCLPSDCLKQTLHFLVVGSLSFCCTAAGIFLLVILQYIEHRAIHTYQSCNAHTCYLLVIVPKNASIAACDALRVDGSEFSLS